MYFKNFDAFETEVERLYLGPPRDYRIHLAKASLIKVEKIFDSLVMHYGVKDVFFEYHVTESSPSEEISVELSL